MAEHDGGDRVECWWIDLDAADASEATLSVRERKRAARLRIAVVRRRFVAGRSAVRRILADRLGCAAGEVAFVEGPHGKPALADGKLRFNLSHSGGVAVLAVSPDRELGVDCEAVGTDPDEMRAAIEAFLSPAERAILAGCDRQSLPLHRIWTRKEALAKAVGLGLSLPLDTLTVLPGGQPIAVPGHGSFRLVDIAAPLGIVAALCGAGPGPMTVVDNTG